MAEIEIIKEIEGEKIEIRALNVHFVFGYDGNAIRIERKFKPFAQIDDPAACYVPSALFNKVCRLAAARLKKKKNKPRPLPLFPFPDLNPRR